MKKIKILLGLLLVAFVLAGCASTGGTMHDGESVKCPACGYEFNVPSDA
jgi:predicted small secreted protein